MSRLTENPCYYVRKMVIWPYGVLRGGDERAMVMPCVRRVWLRPCDLVAVRSGLTVNLILKLSVPVVNGFVRARVLCYAARA